MPRQTRRNKTQAKEDPPSDFEMEENENESIASENAEEIIDQDESSKVEEEVTSDAEDQDEDADAAEMSDEEAPQPKKAPKKKRGKKSASASDEAPKAKKKTKPRSKPKKAKEESMESSASEPKSKPKSRRDLWMQEPSRESIMPRLSVNRSIEVKIDKKWRQGWIKSIDAEAQRVHVTYVETELVTGEDGRPRKKTTKAEKIVRISSKTIRHTSRRESIGTVSLDALVGSYS